MLRMMQVRIRKPAPAGGWLEAEYIDLDQFLIAMLRAGIERDVDDRDPSPAEIDAAANEAARSALADLTGRIDEALRQLSELRRLYAEDIARRNSFERVTLDEFKDERRRLADLTGRIDEALRQLAELRRRLDDLERRVP